MDRIDMIDALIQNDKVYIQNCGDDWLTSILENGFIGYNNMDDGELATEMAERGITENA